MNANNIVGHFFRVIDIQATWRLSPNAYLMLLYLWRGFALSQKSPVLWRYEEADIDLRTLRGAHRELVHHEFVQQGELGSYVLLNPETHQPLVYPKPRKRFDGIRTFRFPWFVLDYRRLNASEMRVYARLWEEKNHRVYLNDREVAVSTGMSVRTVKRCLQSLQQQKLIVSETMECARLAKIKNKSFRLNDVLQSLSVTGVTRIRQITLCDPERPGVKCTPRTLLRQWIDFAQIRDGDVMVLLHMLGVKVFHEKDSTIICELPNAGRNNDALKVDPKTGFSLVPTEQRNRKGKRKAVRQSLWELAYIYKGEDGYGIVRRWHDDLIKRNAIRDVMEVKNND